MLPVGLERLSGDTWADRQRGRSGSRNPLLIQAPRSLSATRNRDINAKFANG